MPPSVNIHTYIHTYMNIGVILGSGRDVKIFHLLALGSSLLAQGFWNGHGNGSMGRPAVGRLPLS